MNRQTLSKKSRDELNGSLLTLYQKLTFKPETGSKEKEGTYNDPVYNDTNVDQPDHEEK